jgi:hypothetical protein
MKSFLSLFTKSAGPVFSEAENAALKNAAQWKDSCGRVYKLEQKDLGENKGVKVRGVTDVLSVGELFKVKEIDTIINFEEGTLTFCERRAPSTLTGRKTKHSISAELIEQLDAGIKHIPSHGREKLQPVLRKFAETVAADGSLRVLALVVKATFDGSVAKCEVGGLKSVHSDELKACERVGADVARSIVNMRRKTVTMYTTATKGKKRSRDE